VSGQYLEGSGTSSATGLRQWLGLAPSSTAVVLILWFAITGVTESSERSSAGSLAWSEAVQLCRVRRAF
jgi:hypothetical protein